MKRIHRKFVRDYDHELSAIATIKGLDGRIWKMCTENFEENTWFQDGWHNSKVDRSMNPEDNSEVNRSMNPKNKLSGLMPRWVSLERQQGDMRAEERRVTVWQRNNLPLAGLSQ
ncbi:hypothetical protein O6P43_008293 [Quillaja saponaria]|uniref:Uncharacterized protein n=1 Tax=Quillaja saponaria TaxID=32244 RepID=A0AAD7PVR5_QUISA|nr:hypothetical protein O6P43_008293 [Quillaja saponaria]